uniref:BTB domain-containing protein n=1 Tax=Steinernema glaseri TaxID=37863 RepID=A0A1I7Z4P8_9BILA
MVSSMPSTSRLNLSGLTSSRHKSANITQECITMIDPVQLCQKWHVSNFASTLKLAQPGVCLRSQVFRDAQLPEACWQLCLYPGGKREENRDNVSLFLKMSATSPMKEVQVKAEYKFYFLDDRGEARFSNINIGDFHAKPPKCGHSWGLRNIPKNKVLGCLRDDESLMISCHILLIPDLSRVVCRKITPTMRITDNVQVARLYFERMHEMLQTGHASDCTIVCEGESFQAHKFVLMTQSDVFKAMFSHKDMTENLDSVIRLSDTSSFAVQQMLTYMYSGNLPPLIDDDQASAVMQLADKYGIDHLKILCEERLIEKLDLDNVCLMMHLADSHNAMNLKTACSELVCLYNL